MFIDSIENILYIAKSYSLFTKLNIFTFNERIKKWKHGQIG